MQRIKLDSIDRKILAELQADGRMTNVELAKRVQISPPPCLRRVRALEEAGIIKGYRALVDEKATPPETYVFKRGDVKNRGPRVAPRPPGVILASQSGERVDFG